MNALLLSWLIIATVRIGYFWLAWYVWPKRGEYIVWIDGLLNFFLPFVVPETLVWMTLCHVTRKDELAPDAALVIPFMCRFSLFLLATSFLIALLVFR